jgi:hypothetical protein
MAAFDRHSLVYARLPVASHLRFPTITNGNVPALINDTTTNTEKCRSPVHNLSWPFKAFGRCKPDDHRQHLAKATSSAPDRGRGHLPSPLDGEYKTVYSVLPSAFIIPSPTSSKEKQWHEKRIRTRAAASSPHFSGPASGNTDFHVSS